MSEAKKLYTHTLSQRNMNFTTVNRKILGCGLAFLPINSESIADLRAVSIVNITVNALTCPLIILLNILVMVAVKTKPQLRAKSNIALACLATSDLLVGVLVQPLHIIKLSFLLNGQMNIFCKLEKVSKFLTSNCLMASSTHLILISAERYVAVTHPFAYEDKVTKVRIIIASGLAWLIALLLSTKDVFKTRTDSVGNSVVFIVVPILLYLPAMIYFNCVVYKEVRRNEKQIAANQVSLEAKEKLLKNKKAFYTTTVVLLAFFACIIPVNICLGILAFTTDGNPANGGKTAMYLLPLMPVLNSLFNPLIYSVRIRYFRVAFIELLAKKTASQAEELERKIFGPRQIGVIAHVEQEPNIRARREDVRQENETYDNGHEITQYQQRH